MDSYAHGSKAHGEASPTLPLSTSVGNYEGNDGCDQRISNDKLCITPELLSAQKIGKC